MANHLYVVVTSCEHGKSDTEKMVGDSASTVHSSTIRLKSASRHT